MNLLIRIALFLFCAGATGPDPLPDFPKVRYSPDIAYESIGFMMGFVENLTWDGTVFWSYEGQLSLGYGTQPGNVEDHVCIENLTSEAQGYKDETRKNQFLSEIPGKCLVVPTPWFFSSLSTPLYDKYNRMGRKYLDASPVVVYYEIPMWSPYRHLIMRTKTTNFVEDIYRTDPNYSVPRHYEVPKGDLPIVQAGVNQQIGMIPQARIVKASMDNYIRKVYTVTIQENLIGNNFRNMNVNDAGMFDYLVSAMLTGRPVRLEYYTLQDWETFVMGIRGYRTPQRITKVDLLDPDPQAQSSIGH